MTTEEIKQQARKEFDEVCKTVNVAELLDQDFDLKFKSFIDSIIDKTVQMTEEMIAKEVKIIADNWFSKAPKYRTKKDLLETLSLITNKSDINK